VKSSKAHGFGDHVLHHGETPQQAAAPAKTPVNGVYGEAVSAPQRVTPTMEPAAEPARALVGLTAAEAWCWAAYMHRTEANDLAHRWPRSPENEAAAYESEQRAGAAYERAVSLDASDGLWRSAMTKWDGCEP
jgi:hypothetical protein